MSLNDGIAFLNAEIPARFLVPGKYTVFLALHIPNIEVLSILDDMLGFEIEETGTDFYTYHGNDYGCVFADVKWTS